MNRKELNHQIAQYQYKGASGNGQAEFAGDVSCVLPSVVFYGACGQSGTPAPEASVPININNGVWTNGERDVDLSAIELLGIGSAKDTYDAQTGRLTRRIGKIVLSGDRTRDGLNYSDTYYKDCYAAYQGNYNKYPRSDNDFPCLCSHYIGIPVTPSQVGQAGKVFVYSRLSVTRFSVGFSRFEFADKNSFLSFLQTEYANGTPVTVYYVFAEPVVSYIAPQQPLTQSRGSNTIRQISGDIENTGISVTYVTHA